MYTDDGAEWQEKSAYHLQGGVQIGRPVRIGKQHTLSLVQSGRLSVNCPSERWNSIVVRPYSERSLYALFKFGWY
jgi:hypothetical protein